MTDDTTSPDDNPLMPGKTSRGTTRVLISVEVAVDDPTQLVADSRFLEGMDDEIGHQFATADAALADSIAEHIATTWPTSSRLVGQVNVMTGSVSTAHPID